MKDLRFAENFLFTQHSLSTFDNCPMKFRKRYLEDLKWSSFPDENTKKRLEAGNNFHLAAYRYFLGLDTGLNDTTESPDELNLWTEALKSSFLIEPEVTYLPEHKLRMSTPVLKLEANFDLIIARRSGLEIWDWKTHGESSGSRRKHKSRSLGESLQTTVYMYVLKELSHLVAGRSVNSEDISMYYWQPEPPMTVAEIRYDDKTHEAAGKMLEEKVSSILEYDYSCFDKQLYSVHCRYCEFSWFCNGVKVDFAAVAEDEDLLEELEWDAIEERY